LLLAGNALAFFLSRPRVRSPKRKLPLVAAC
jgi:hypothetical protein